MKLYVARHGETEWNRLNKVCGRTDSPLTDKGLQQAQLLAERLDSCSIDVIIASPLSRAQETARAVAERKHLPVLTDERLIEQDYGVYEGVQRDDRDFLNNKRICRVICSYFMDMTNEEYFGFSQDNCGYNIYEC